ncbi:MAG: hypothetical protein JKY56_00425 [Kofleriaceae bacterium]|nr:hypothetical protein [Kofleriaceae bacterium]
MLSLARQALFVLVASSLMVPSIAVANRGKAAAPKTAKQFAKKATTGRQYFLAGHRVPKQVGRFFNRWSRKRTLVHVDNQNMASFIGATKKGYLEVVIPANTGHVWFRVGTKLYDFGPKGFRVSGVRAITKERYGVLVKLSEVQEKNLLHYLDRLETTKGAELGKYNFSGGDKGFHCVTWLMRHSFGEGNFVKMLGGSPKDGKSMPNFSEFMVKRARNVEAVVVYNKAGLTSASLDKKKFDIMTIEDLRRVFAETGRPD